MESMCEIRTNEGENQQKGNKQLLLDPIKLQKFTLACACRCVHISCLKSNQFWVNFRNNLILTNTKGDIIDHLKDAYSGYGIHTVNNNSELIYINKDYDIKKVTLMTTKILKKKDDSELWTPKCVYWSNSNKHLLVGMCTKVPLKGKVNRYNQTAQLIQTIQQDKRGMHLYKKPNYITENNNGDVVVSDYWSCAVVVTDQGGMHRFSYTGHPSGSLFWPRGICTDAMSHILVCDLRTDTIHMLNLDGHFLSHLSIKPVGKSLPYCLSFDANTHRLWVGSYNSVSVYNYVSREDVSLGRSDYLLLL